MCYYISVIRNATQTRKHNMAKEEKKAAAATPAADNKKTEKNTGGGSADKFKYVGENKDHKLPPQARQIADLLKAAPGGTLTREKLLEQASKVVVTKQPIGRILSYYQKRLTDNGFVSVEK